MKKLFKWIFWLAVAAGLGYGGYTIYNATNDEETPVVEAVEVVEEPVVEAETPVVDTVEVAEVAIEETNVELNTEETNE